MDPDDLNNAFLPREEGEDSPSGGGGLGHVEVRTPK